MLFVSLVAAIAAQAAAASGYHHTRTKGGAVASEQFRNSNAYAPPSDIAGATRRSVFGAWRIALR